jgi:cell division protease FtsH
VSVTTKASAPGGARTERVGLPYDPDLFDHLVDHGVFVETPDPNPAMPVLHSIARLVFPIFFSFLLVKVTFRIGRKKTRDKIFGGTRMELVRAKDATITFKDVAGIEQVKAEVMEVVQFLRSPKKFLELGARSPAGVLLIGPPGTGKTLLARAVAGEAGVPFYSIAGTEFMEMFVGVGAARVRDMFAQARKNAPCILFIDEFDGLGKAREYGGSGNDESVHTINQLLTEMDGFEDNTGVVVMAATNRPNALDAALTRPGRFDRIIQLPLPNIDGRADILRVHARGKKVDPNLDYHRIARATAGATGADLMSVMNRSAILAARQATPFITNDQVYASLETLQREQALSATGDDSHFQVTHPPPAVRRAIAIYEAAKAILGHITPGYDELQRVSACPGGIAVGYTFFLPHEERLETGITTRSYLEASMVVALAGRCAEMLVLGEAGVSTAGAADLMVANAAAREMVYRCGFGRRVGPVALMDDQEVFLNRSQSRRIADISTEMAMVAYADVKELMEAAEAKVTFFMLYIF